MNEELRPARRFVRPRPGDSWEDLARRELPDRAVEDAVNELQSWNLHVHLRPPTAPMTVSDILFVEPPRSTAFADAT